MAIDYQSARREYEHLAASTSDAVQQAAARLAKLEERSGPRSAREQAAVQADALLTTIAALSQQLNDPDVPDDDVGDGVRDASTLWNALYPTSPLHRVFDFLDAIAMHIEAHLAAHEVSAPSTPSENLRRAALYAHRVAPDGARSLGLQMNCSFDVEAFESVLLGWISTPTRNSAPAGGKWVALERLLRPADVSGAIPDSLEKKYRQYRASRLK